MTSLTSIIVPVYNVDKYLSSCVESILSQTCPNWELVLVDDGSSDNSGAICDVFAKRDNRIKVYHKENGGVSSARNFGISKSIGNLIMFVDSDDQLDARTVETCSGLAEEYDMIRFGAKEIYKNGKESIINIEEISLNQYIKNVISKKGLVSVWGGVYKRKLLENEKFDESLKRAEDWKFLFNVLAKTKCLKCINKPLYLYSKMNENSTTYTKSVQNEIDSLKVFKYIKNHDFTKRYNREINNAKLHIYHKLLSTAVLENGFNLLKTLNTKEIIKPYLGNVSLVDLWNSDLSTTQKMVDFFSLWEKTLHIYLLIYKRKYKNGVYSFNK